MENGRIEPLRALPVHREAQLCLQLPKAKYVRPLEAPGRFLEGFWKPWRPACGRYSFEGSEKTIFSRWELRA